MDDDWQSQVRLGLEELVDKALVKGAKQTDIFAAIDEELARLRVALDRDPDPAEDRAVAVQEPSNDWPPADG
jgi:hypothetical protein